MAEIDPVTTRLASAEPPTTPAIKQAKITRLLTLAATIGFALVATGGFLIAAATARPISLFLVAGGVILLALALLPLLVRLQKDASSPGTFRLVSQAKANEPARSEAAMEHRSSATVRKMRHQIQRSFAPSQAHIYLFDSARKLYSATPDETGEQTSDLTFPVESGLPNMLANLKKPISLADETSQKDLKSEAARLTLLGAQVFIPIPGSKQLTGWLALGPRRSGEAYSEDDLSKLQAIAENSRVALETTLITIDQERRATEMNILMRVSQGINITVALDDILELIYAQTTQLIQTRDFSITLSDSANTLLYHVFYVEDDERMREKEHQPIQSGIGLAGEVIKTQLPVVTDDYTPYCRSLGLLPEIEGLYAWVGVPLNAGAETIGAISLGSRDINVVYASEQINFLQAIADQTAGAIVKARLLQESELRTKQLTSLNEVARSLTSTLELDPLLNQILVSAVEILNCEAGSLLLVDKQTDELIFEVTAGPVASTLLGQRLPAGTGLAGKAVTSRQAIIANDVRQRQDWFAQPDQQTGFTTRDILAVPMQIKDQVTGVIEVINRKDGLPFTYDDQELLTAFTSQAAIAIENARLYTLTDQTLAARVEELSVMQRIDRELNASLDIHRALRSTLEWALRRSEAEAGLVGVVEENGLQIMASQGYPYEVSASNSHPNETTDHLQEVLETGQPVSFYPGSGGEPGIGYLETAQARIIIPIQRESSLLGLILLETIRPGVISDETIAFLSRLSDHAAIAIANARLYGEVQAANLAKSDFVSFVSHELKTPMTSIKGFTDLLASGVVGQINEAQGNFLGTIRSNVDRMATLVSDLADVSRIEAGRLRLDFAAVEVIDVIQEVVRSTHAQLEDKEQSLTVEAPTDLPNIWGDRTRLIQILTNLVSNANKYTPQGGQILITAKTTQNEWDPGGVAQVVHLTVHDNGFGMTPEDQAKTFQKFFRSEDQKIREASGTGLGLNITKTLVEMQGGKIWFESEFRQGTTFHFTIPVVESS